MSWVKGFSTEWDDCYRDRTQMSLWPWSDVVSLVHRFCGPLISAEGHTANVLEMGCGAGANIPFFRALKFNYKAIEGSSTVVDLLHHKYPDLINSIVCGDFTSTQPFADEFDIILDRAAITHNDGKSIKRVINKVFSNLKPGGIFIGVDWFSENHSDFAFGVPINDKSTRSSFTQGQFKGVGKVHFSSEMGLRKIFKDFEILQLEEKIVRRLVPNDQRQFASWNIVARKASA